MVILVKTADITGKEQITLSIELGVQNSSTYFSSCARAYVSALIPQFPGKSALEFAQTFPPIPTCVYQTQKYTGNYKTTLSISVSRATMRNTSGTDSVSHFRPLLADQPLPGMSGNPV